MRQQTRVPRAKTFAELCAVMATAIESCGLYTVSTVPSRLIWFCSPNYANSGFFLCSDDINKIACAAYTWGCRFLQLFINPGEISTEQSDRRLGKN